jgi:ribosomal protein S18 acetylase RimI-like enzyme
MDITVRPAVPADAAAVLALMRELAEHEGLSQYFHLTLESLTRYCFTAPARLELLVAAGDGVVGYVAFMAQLSPWAGRDYLYVDDVYVAADHRGTGAGSLLMKRIGEIAMERDMDVRWHVEAENIGAQKFYGSIGAELRSRFTAYWSREAIATHLARGTRRREGPRP